ncbi:perivitellin-2 67 kDa subunit-like protein, partial [Dinothrombium tinctorium]
MLRIQSLGEDMKTILFLLLFCVAVHRCLSATCSNVIPGLVKLSRGVDITKLDLTPLDTTEDDGFDRRIFDFTCNKKAMWTSPYNPGVAYDLPDQVETANSIPGGVLDASVKIHTSFNDVKRSMSSKAGVSFLKGMFSLSGSYKRFEHSIANNSRRIAEVEAFFSAIQLDFLPFWDLSLSNSALNYINKVLPVNYESDPSKFNDFIKYFGTHYFSTGKFGGLFRVSILMESSLLQTMSSRDIEANAKGSFFKILKAKGGYSGSMTSVSEQFSSKTQIAARFYGGNANLLDVDSWNNWWSSVPSNPWLFAGKLEPIINLIPDGPKKEAMKVAFNVYLDKAYLTEIQRLLYSFLNKGKVGEERALQFLNRANALISQLIPDHNAVEALGSEVEKFITVPEWFLTRTQLCYQWYPDGDGGQCSAPS